MFFGYELISDGVNLSEEKVVVIRDVWFFKDVSEV